MSKLTTIEKKALRRLRTKATKEWKAFRAEFPDPGRVTDPEHKAMISEFHVCHLEYNRGLNDMERELKRLREEEQPVGHE